MSQMSGILQGYESIATKDLLKATPTQAPVTPGKAVDSEEPVETSSSEGTSDKSGVPTDAVQSNTATTTLDNSALASSASSKAAAAPMATANAQVLINGVAAAVGVIGIAML